MVEGACPAPALVALRVGRALDSVARAPRGAQCRTISSRKWQVITKPLGASARVPRLPRGPAARHAIAASCGIRVEGHIRLCAPLAEASRFLCLASVARALGWVQHGTQDFEAGPLGRRTDSLNSYSIGTRASPTWSRLHRLPRLQTSQSQRKVPRSIRPCLRCWTSGARTLPGTCRNSSMPKSRDVVQPPNLPRHRDRQQDGLS